MLSKWGLGYQSVNEQGWGVGTAQRYGQGRAFPPAVFIRPHRPLPRSAGSSGLAFDRGVFVNGLSEVRSYRNRLMHFRDPLKPAELERLTNFCDAVREIQL